MANIQINITANKTTTLLTRGKRCDRDIEIRTDVPVPDGYICPAGTLDITENGEGIDVTGYEKVNVNVPSETVEEYDGTITVA